MKCTGSRIAEIVMATETHLFGKRATGRKELRTHLRDGKVGLRDAIIAKCYDCMGGYTDGVYECKIPDCPLYPYMPYNSR